jgi:hypothetical protein
MTYREFTEHIKRSAVQVRRNFTAPDDDWLPVALMELPNGRMAVSPLPLELFSSDAGKDALVEALCALVRQFKARKLGLVLSAWTAPTPKGPEAEAAIARGEYPGGRPSQRPDREEAVYVCVYDAERTELTWAPILRSRRRPPRLGDWAEPWVHGQGGAELDGRFADGRIAEALR